MLATAKSFVARYERRLSAAAFLLGFLWDNLTLSRIDRLFDNLVLASYLVIALGSIALLNAHGAGRLRGAWARRGADIFQFLLPFAFGGLFSGFLIFYSRSGPILASAPFLFILALFFFGNEFFKRHYARFVFQLAVFFTALFSYAALIVPVLLRRIGDAVFLLSGLAALLLFGGVLAALRRVARDEVQRSRRILLPIVGMIYITFNLLYFNNMIPPIPLSLKEIGVYHGVERAADGGYRLFYEAAPWYALTRETSTVFHRAPREGAFVFSSVYAPTELRTEIAHRWEYFSATGGPASPGDTTKGKWLLVNIIRFPISGGRAEGFRGYSVKENIQPGRWRVSVETLRGQVIGRLIFTVADAEAPPALAETVR